MRDVTITISGPIKSGKTTIAGLIRGLLKDYGAHVGVVDPDGDVDRTPAEIKAILEDTVIIVEVVAPDEAQSVPVDLEPLEEPPAKRQK